MGIVITFDRKREVQFCNDEIMFGKCNINNLFWSKNLKKAKIFKITKEP